MKGIFCLLAALVIGVVLCTFPGSAPAADTTTDLPARVETNQYLPPAPGAALAPRPTETLEVSTAAVALPGQPLQKVGRAGRGVIRFLFRGRARGRGGCG